MDVVKTNIDMNELVKHVIQELDNGVNKKTIYWTIKDLPHVEGEMSTLRQVWINLISNAIKYSGKADKPCIEIGSYTADSQIVFYVKDNGVGFDQQYRNKLFKVFQRLHNSEEFEGTGVGLAIVEKIVSRHGGKTWAEAEVNNGATFYFSLPSTSVSIYP